VFMLKLEYVKIPISSYRIFVGVWALALTVNIIAMLAASLKVEAIPLIGKITLGTVVLSGTFSIILFFVNQFIFYPALRILSKVTFALSSISLVVSISAFMYFNPHSTSLVIGLWVLLTFHLLIFWKSNNYYKYIESKRLQKNIDAQKF
jgi:hypothetical protein